MADTCVRASAVVREFDGGGGVRGVDLAVRAGEIHALVGLNGAGKSTLLRLLLGMLRPQAGSVELAGRDLRRLGARDWSAVGHLVESAFAYPELTVRANLELSARLHGIVAASVAVAVEAIVAEFGLGPYADRCASRLSTGNRQRLGLASALQHDPRVIVLDEPTNALDPSGVILLRESLLRRASAGAAVLVSSHHLDEVARIADTITVLNAGRVIGTLDPGLTEIERAFFDLVLADDEVARQREGTL